MAPRQWFRVQTAADDPTVADLYVFDLIGDWIDDLWGFDGVTTAKTFQAALDQLGAAVKTIRLHVNSPGGDVFSAVTIANMLRDQRTTKGRRVETSVEGLAASAASIIIQAGDPIRIGDNALVMIHNPWSVALGEAKDFRQAADELDTVRQTIIATYKWHSELSDAEIAALMDSTTWMSADEAIANGFATEKVEGLKAAASLDRRALAKLTIPDKYRARVEALLKPAPAPAPSAANASEILHVCAEAGLDLAFAQTLIGAQATLADAHAKATAEQAARAQALAREKDIRAICKTAKLDELADGYVNGQMSVAHVKGHVTTITAKVDRVEIDGGLDPDRGARHKPVLDVTAIYAARNQLPAKKE